MNFYLRKITSAIVCLILFSCTASLPESLGGDGSDIIGTVVDKTTGEPVGTVEITLTPGGKKIVTGSDGAFQFAGLESGTYTLTLEKDGYKKESTIAVVFDGKRTELHLLIERIPAVITADREVLEFGSNAGVTQMSVSIVNPGYLSLHWSVSWDNQVKWISSVLGQDGKSEGTLGFGKTASLVVKIDRDALANGYNEAVIVIWSENGRSELKVTATGADRRFATTNVLAVSNVQTTSATLTAEVTSAGSPAYTERGFVISTSPINSDASISGLQTVSSPLNNNAQYSASVTNLSKGVRYYVRAYAINPIGTKLSSNEVEFTTIGAVTEVQTLAVSSLDLINKKVQLNGQITVAGSPVYTEKGFCYNMTGEPTIANTKIVVSGNSTGNFSYSLPNLTTQKTYYVRAYAIQEGKVIYGSTVNFSTSLITTSITTLSATNVSSTAATLCGMINLAGSPAFVEKGFFITESKTVISIDDCVKYEVSGINEGSYTYQVSNLKHNTSYTYCAYAVQNGTIVRDDFVSFKTTYTQAQVQTNAITNINYTSLTLNGQVLSKGDPSISERGFCYSTTNRYPTYTDNVVKVSGTTATTYKTTLNNLSEGTLYYVRAYVKQGDDIIYGGVVSEYTALSPQVLTGPVKDLSLSSNNITWQVTFQGAFADGDPSVTKAGFVYSTVSNPTYSSTTFVAYDKCTKNSQGIFVFVKTLTNLFQGQTYHVRAYVKNSLGEIYGEDISFTTY